MSRKHNVKKRTTSNYKQRLLDRGLGKAPRMPSVESLRNRQPSRSTYDQRKTDYPGLVFNQSPLRTPWSKLKD